MVRIEKSYQEHKGLQIPVYSISGQFMGDPAREEFRSKFRSGLAHGEIYNVVDLKEMTWINSTGIGALITAHIATTESHGKLIFASPSRRIESIFYVTNLINVFDVKPDLEKALEEAYTSISRASIPVYRRGHDDSDR